MFYRGAVITSPVAMSPFLKLLGARLKALRLEQGLSVAEVAHELGCDVSSIYSMEKGRHAPSFQRLNQLAELLKLDELDLFTFPTEKTRHELIEMTRHASMGTLAAMKAACQKVLDDEQRAKRRPKRL
jgi:transcriptional regulator with XRE-family HTH domain